MSPCQAKLILPPGIDVGLSHLQLQRALIADLNVSWLDLPHVCRSLTLAWTRARAAKLEALS